MLLHPLSDDLDYILTKTHALWEEFRNKNIFITGGTGFFGCWLLESFSRANCELKLNAQIHVLTRNAKKFIDTHPVLANQSFIYYHEGDIRSYEFPTVTFSHVIHAGNSTHPEMTEEEQLSIIIDGTERTLKLAKANGAEKFLLVSSGAVYGKQSLTTDYLTEETPFVIHPHDSAYIIGKRQSESLAKQYANNFAIKIARCFAFVGPYLPLDSHFAIGNFIQDALQDKTIHVKSTDTVRSYLYAADLMIWLWTILTQGQPLRPYNVGSDQAIGMADLARLTGARVSINHGDPSRYIPAITRAQTELGLTVGIDLQTAIQKTMAFKKSSY